MAKRYPAGISDKRLSPAPEAWRSRLSLRTGRLNKTCGGAMRRLLLLLVAFGPAGAGQPLQEDPRLALLDRVRQRMAQNLEHLPDFTCLETVDRSVRAGPKRDLIFRDRIRLEVAFIGLKEFFAWPGSAKFEHTSWDEMVSGGFSEFGNFGSWTHALFKSSGAHFEYGGEQVILGRRAPRFDFRVPLRASGFRLSVHGQAAVVPYSGAVWVDPELQVVRRLEVRAGPNGLPFKTVIGTADYAQMRIGEADFLLPESAAQTMVDTSEAEYHNDIRFSGCRQYGAESSISFDATPAGAAPAKKQTEKLEIPDGVTLDVRLQSPITFEKSAVGDPVTARLDHMVKAGGIQLPKGATLSGRIRRLEQVYLPEKVFYVGLELSSAAFANKQATFAARLVGPPLKNLDRTDSLSWVVNPAYVVTESTGLDIDESEVRFGVFRVHAGSLRIAKGLKMSWRTGREAKAGPPPTQVAIAAPLTAVPAAQTQAATVVQPQAPQFAPPPLAPPSPAPVTPTPQERQPVIRVTATMVEVQVLVHGRDGKPVAGLGRDDFVLLDKGRPQAITSFSVIAGEPSDPVVAPEAKPGETERQPSKMPASATVLLFDKLNTHTSNLNDAKRQIIGFLKKTGAQEPIAIFTLDGRLHVLADFTNDNGALARSLESLGGLPSSLIDASEPATPETMTRRFKMVEREIGRADRIIAEMAVAERAELTLAALETIGRQLARVPGRKNLIWISDGFPLTMNLEGTGDYMTKGVPRAVALNLSGKIARTARVLTDANVAIYPVEARGLVGVSAADPSIGGAGRVMSSTAAQGQERMAGVDEDTSVDSSIFQTWAAIDKLAFDTGGRAFRGSNDIAGSVRQALDDARVVYVLGYQPDHGAWDGKFRPIEVRVKRTGARVRYRRGYFAVGDARAPGG